MQPSKKVIVFDFDGVLAIPYTNPEKHYDPIPHLIKTLQEEGYVLAIASFNPRAKTVIEEWGLSHHFSAIRHGSNHVWEGHYLESYREDLLKSKQIQSMMKNELKDVKVDDVIFFDDDPSNIDEVFNALKIQTHVIDHRVGLHELYIHMIV